jgi:nucleoid DNA-binding protein
LDIASYIKELILTNECVILPQFGGFIAKYRPAKVDPRKKILVPPSKEIEFHGELTKDNGLLVNYIARKNKTFNTRARRLVEDFVREINERLGDGEKVVFEGIGTFVRDKDSGRLLFYSLSDENYLIDSYGLMDLELDELATHGAAQEEEVKTPAVKIVRRKQTGIWIAASITVIVLLLVLIIPLTDSGYLFRLNFGILGARKSESLKRSENEKIVFGKRRMPDQDTVKNLEKIIDNATRKEVALFYSEPEKEYDESIVNRTNNQASRYYLIAGSFKRLDNAQRLKTDLLNHGYSPQILQTKNGYYRVTLSSFDNRNLAIRELQRIRKNLNLTVWILSI